MKTDRRAFLGAATGATAAAALGFSAEVEASDGRGMIVVNALGGLGDPNDPRDGLVPNLSPRVLAEAHASGVTAINVTLGYVSGEADPFESSVRDIAASDALVREHARDVLKVFAAADIRRARQEGRIGLIYGFQNGAMMGEDPSRVDIFAGLGVRVFQLTYNPANLLGDGSMAPGNRGITPLGRDVIARCNANRVMVDLSHSGEQTCLEAARASAQPISVNHTGCRALTDLPRNKTDEELRLVAERGGFVGIYFMPFLNPTGHARAADVVAHLEHAVNVCGEDHVGIGTDGSVTQIDDLDAYRAVLAKEIADRRAAGISAAGERPDTFPFVADLRGPDQFHKLAALLKGRGWSEARIAKVMGLNFLRYAEAVWGA
ncbi:peptidase M19 [Novosphingobium sp. PC22D]|uniref:dipeptidase n=1 Tax=Novosphingobium sp. PC22D TaxID=1962403 RepID=UPI000BEF5976|nr:membrane dipeptidase [Novosphingobium sp. PC22D]PEQ12267.1 peptidase M19 [Novosphingobium sp. PC22D]